MGYYTLHRIKIINEYNSKENLEKLEEIMEKITEYTFYLSDDDLVLTDYNEDNRIGTKWYECEKEMRAVSRFLPEFLIQVKGKGQNGEIWIFQFQDGAQYEEEFDLFTDSEKENEEEDEEEEEIMNYNNDNNNNDQIDEVIDDKNYINDENFQR